MTRRSKSPASPRRLDALAELDALLDLGRRAPGSDAERRAALHLEQRLARARARRRRPSRSPSTPPGRSPTRCSPPLAVGAQRALGLRPARRRRARPRGRPAHLPRRRLALPTVRRLLGRRASQNVVSWGGDGKPGALVLVAHYDAGRAGLATSDRAARRLAAARRRRPSAARLVFWAELAVLACACCAWPASTARRSRSSQFVPDARADRRRSPCWPTSPWPAPRAARTTTPRAPSSRCASPSASAGASSSTSTSTCSHRRPEGRRRRHARLPQAPRERSPRDRTVVLNVDEVGVGRASATPAARARWSRSASHAQLLALCEQIVEDGSDAQPLVEPPAERRLRRPRGRLPGDHDHLPRPARLRRPDASTSRRCERAEGFCAELIERLDAERPARSLSEPEA